MSRLRRRAGGPPADPKTAKPEPPRPVEPVFEEIRRRISLLPVGVDSWGVETSYDLDAVVPKADVVMMLRVQRERMSGGFFPTAREYSRRYGLDGKRMRQLQDHTIVMHPGPMVRGMEITADVADSTRSVIVEQVTNGVAVRMAVLYLLLSGEFVAAGLLSHVPTIMLPSPWIRPSTRKAMAAVMTTATTTVDNSANRWKPAPYTVTK